MDIRRLLLILLLVYSIIGSRDDDNVQENVQDSDEDDEVSLISSDDYEGNIIIYKECGTGEALKLKLHLNSEIYKRGIFKTIATRKGNFY